MANDIRGEVAFQACGKDWIMKLGNGAVRHVENETGKTFVQIGAELSDTSKASITLLTTVFHASLIKHHPGVTLSDCDDIIDDIGHEEAGTLLGKAVKAMQPQRKGGGDRPRKATAA